MSQDFGGNKYSKNIKAFNKINMPKGFGGNKYSKNDWIMYIINDKF